MFLLSVKAGLRAGEIAALTWAMVTDAEGQVSEALQLENQATKGKKGGRRIPLHPQLRAALTALRQARAEEPEPWHPVLFSERGRGLSAADRADLAPALDTVKYTATHPARFARRAGNEHTVALQPADFLAMV